MLELRITGLSELQRARIRYEFSQDDTVDYEGDPFDDAPIEVEIEFGDLVRVLRAAEGALTGITAVPRHRPALSRGGRTDWAQVVESVLNGDVDTFVDRLPRASAYAMKSKLLRRFTGIEVTTTKDRDAAMAILTVKAAR